MDQNVQKKKQKKRKAKFLYVRPAGPAPVPARAFKVRGPNLKVGRPKFFLLIKALKKHAVHNAIASINNSFMQPKIILIGVTRLVQNCFFWSISVIISNNILLFQQEGGLQAPPVGYEAEPRKPEHF